MAGRIRAFDRTLVGNHVYSREEVLGSNTTTSNWSPNVFASRWHLLRNAPSNGHNTRYITLFFKGTYSVISFHELMGMSCAGWQHFLR